MKNITFIIAMLVGSICWGQKKDSALTKIVGDISATTFMSLSGTTTIQMNPKQDTVKVLLLICDISERYTIWPSFETDTVATRIFTDTSKSSWKDYAVVGSWKSDTTNRYYNNQVWWQFGYEVIHNSNVIYFDKDGLMIFQKDYLDENKKPLSKSIIVWMSKEIK